MGCIKALCVLSCEQLPTAVDKSKSVDDLRGCLVSQGHSLSDGLDDVQRAEMKAYMELVNNMLLTAEVRTD